MQVDREVLSRLSKTPAYALEIGKAAEHLVCADLLLRGHRAFLSDQGLPYDVLVEINKTLFRIQVKGCCFPADINKAGVNPVMRYKYFSIRRCGKGGRRHAALDECDLIALVGIDIGRVAYLPYALMPSHCALAIPKSSPSSVLSRPLQFDDLTFEQALDDFKTKRKRRSQRGKLIEVDGVFRTIKEWSLLNGISISSIHHRLGAGWSSKDAVFVDIDITRVRKNSIARLMAPETLAKRGRTHKEWWANQRKDFETRQHLSDLAHSTGER